jgi:hypothetical protein
MLYKSIYSTRGYIVSVMNISHDKQVTFCITILSMNLRVKLYFKFDEQLIQQAVWLQTQNDAYLEIVLCTLLIIRKKYI